MDGVNERHAFLVCSCPKIKTIMFTQKNTPIIHRQPRRVPIILLVRLRQKRIVTSAEVINDLKRKIKLK